MHDDLEAMQAGWACTALVTRLYLALDEHAYDALDDLFTVDAEWVRLGQRTGGLEAIRSLMRRRPVDLATRHVITNPVVTLDGEGTASGSFYMLVVRKHGVTPAMQRPLPVAGPWRLSVVHAGFRRTHAGWRIANQHTLSQFEFPEEVHA